MSNHFDAYVGSSAQKRLYLVNRLMGDSILYNMPNAWVIEGPFHHQRLEEAFKKMIQRQETLRTCFLMKDERVLQKVYEDLDFKLDYRDLRGKETEIETLLTDFLQPFSLEKAPLWRTQLVRLEDEKYLLMLDTHHIISDGVSMNVFFTELTTLYNGAELPEMEFQYVDFTMWQNEFFEEEKFKAQKQYWLNRFQGDIPELELPYDFPRRQDSANEGEVVEVSAGPLLTEQLNRMVTDSGSTMFSLLLTVYHILLYSYSGNRDICVGTPVSGRPHREFESIIGMFVNTLVMRNKLETGRTFRQLLAEVSKNAFEALENQDYQFEMLVEALNLDRRLNRNPLFDVMFAMQNFGMDAGGIKAKYGGLTITAFQFPRREAKFDLTLSAAQEGDSLAFQFEFRTSLFRAETIKRMSTFFIKILEEVTHNPDIGVTDIDILTVEEKQRVLIEFNQPVEVQPPAGHQTLHGLFRDRALKYPDNTALIGLSDGSAESASPSDLTEMTYAQLDALAESIAAYLKQKGVKRGDIVTVRADVSQEMAAALLGVMKAEGAYLPIDPAYPAQRMNYMVKDSGAKLLLLGTGKNDKLHDLMAMQLVTGTCEVIPLETAISEGREALKNEEKKWVVIESAPEVGGMYANVIYTSGTTGKPKGVLVEHRGLVNSLQWRMHNYNFSTGDVALQLFAYCFDGFGSGFYPPLLSGGAVALLPEERRLDYDYARSLIKERRVTNSVLAPSMYEALLDNAKPGQLDSIRFVALAGEKAPVSLIEHSKKYFPHIQLYNEYGPTEASIVATAGRREMEADKTDDVGQPLPNTHILILDENGNPVPIGVYGEIHITGTGVVPGYLNNPELTHEKFIQKQWEPPEPTDSVSSTLYKKFCGSPEGGFSKEPFGRRRHENRRRHYKTGDRGRWLEDGSIRFGGRIETQEQVKISGYRIELKEIEAVLREHAEVRNGAVTVFHDAAGKPALCAYFQAGKGFGVDELRDYLSLSLPHYMIPAFFVEMEQIPLTAGGKVDRRALPEPVARVDGSGDGFRAPETETQEKVAAAWREVLQVERLGIHDNFFEIGGSSTQIIKLHSRLKDALAEEIEVTELFQYPTVASFVHFIENRNKIEELAEEAESVREIETPAVSVGRDIAVVGMSLRFPGASGIDEFWHNLREGVCSISFFSREELAQNGVSAEMLDNPAFVGATGVVEDKEMFDASFFGYLPVEARLMDPQARLLHKHTWWALEHAGYVPGEYSGAIGLYAGASHRIQRELLAMYSEEGRMMGDFEVSQLTGKDFIPTRVSYKLNLKGPSVLVQSACSTSLLAVHMACKALLEDECRMAVAGGVTVNQGAASGYVYSEGMIMSPDGYCRAFDARARGTVGGEGVGVVVLKRLEHARADNDTIYAVVKGSAANNDGSDKVGYTAPSVEGQKEVIAKAHRLAGVQADTVSYIEAHGTGTLLGDPIEIKALKEAFKSDKKHFCAVGSVKTNVGHMDCAAGVGGFIKAILAMVHREIPPSLHFQSPNPALNLENSPFYIAHKLIPWQREQSRGKSDAPLRAGVSAFGIGGTNVHVVLEEAPQKQAPDESGVEAERERLILLSARNDESLKRAVKNLGDFFNENPGVNLRDAAFTLQTGRKAFEHRAMLVTGSTSDAARMLLGGEDVAIRRVAEELPEIVFMFPGQGSQYLRMGEGLYNSQPVFRETMDRCFDILEDIRGYCLKHVLYPEEGKEVDPEIPGIYNAKNAQPLMFMFQYSMARLLMSFGLKPGAMIGHSLGEFTAACLAGVFSLEDTLRLVDKRGVLMESMPGGAMLSVSMKEEELTPLLGEGVELALVNSSALCVVAGTEEGVEGLEKRLTEMGRQCRKLHMVQGYHSCMMEPIVEPFKKEVAKIQLNEPAIPCISNLTGKPAVPGELTDPEYWGKHLRHTVRFAAGVSHLLHSPGRIFLEVGPGKALSTFVRQHEERNTQPVLNTVRHPEEEPADLRFLLHQVGQLWLYGVPCRWRALYPGALPGRVALPTYPFREKDYTLRGDLAKLAALALGPGSGGGDKPNDAAAIKTADSHRLVTTDGADSAAGDVTWAEDTVDAYSVRDGEPRPDLTSPYIAPRNHNEKKMAEIWRRFFGYDKIGVKDDFFELGGDSLKAMTLIARIRKETGMELALQDFFRMSSVAGLSEHMETTGDSAPGQKALAVEPVEERDYYPLSPAQKRIFFLQQMAPGATAYNMGSVVLLEGKLDREKLDIVMQQLVRRHEAFRTSFRTVQGEPVQVVNRDVFFKSEFFDLSAGVSADGDGEPLSPEVMAELEAQTRKVMGDLMRPFDLRCAPLVRLGVVKQTARRHVLMLDMHHIVSDGSSLSLIVRDLMQYYSGKEPALPRLQYRDYSMWQESEERQEAILQMKEYWRRTFEDLPPGLELPLDFPRPQVRDFSGHSIVFQLDNNTTRALKALAVEHNVTLYMLLLSVFNMLLARLGDCGDIVVGLPTAGRRHADLENIVGMFINTLPMRSRPSGEKSFSAYLREVKESVLDAFENQEYPFEDLVELLNIPRDIARNPLFDTVFIQQNVEVPEIHIEGLTLKEYSLDRPLARFDLSLSCFDREDGILGVLEYCTALFKAGTVERFIGYYKRFVEILPANPAIELERMDILSEKEKRTLLETFNDTAADFPAEKTLHEWFMEQAAKTPANVAVIAPLLSGKETTDGGAAEMRRVTYRELNRRSGRLAALLVEKGCGPGTIAAIVAEPSVEMATAILAVLKAGAAYLPVDPLYPAERVRYLLKDSAAVMVLYAAKETHAGIAETFMRLEIPGLTDNLIDDIDASALPDGDDAFYEKIPASAFANVIYTSGTTGVPKGVAVPHRGIVNGVNWRISAFDYDAADITLQLLSFSFDAFGINFYAPLLSGGSMVMVPGEKRMDYGYTRTLIKQIGVTVFSMSSPMFEALLEGDDGEAMQTLRMGSMGGEKQSRRLLEKSKTLYPRLVLVNEYGPTETTITVTAQPGIGVENAAVIGKPVHNTQLYILSKSGGLQPLGVAGELCVGGVQVTAGYLNDPEKTAACFVPSPVHVPAGGQPVPILYRSGDLARWLEDGTVEFLGRMDAQVKIRGYRIEPGEIEARLSGHPAVKNAVVTVREESDGGKSLCAYYTAVQGEEVPTQEALRDYLLAALPSYMVPAFWVPLDRLPLTTGGKVDLKNLPDPFSHPDALPDGSGLRPPQTVTEQKLAQIWAEVLGISPERIGRDTDFFNIGGHSLKATQVATRILQVLEVNVSLPEVFQYTALKELARFIDNARKVAPVTVPVAEKRDYYPVSPMQKRFYILSEVEGIGTAYNLLTPLTVSRNISLQRLQKAFNELIQRHESLRTSFHMVGGEPVQRIHKAVDFRIETYGALPAEIIDNEQAGKGAEQAVFEHERTAGAAGEDVIRRFLRPFDLSRAPLLRVALAGLENGQVVMLMDIHHIVSDGTSMGVMIRDAIAFYEGKEHTLPPLPVQYKDFSQWQQSPMGREAHRKYEAYWLNLFKGELELPDIYTDFPRPELQSFVGDTVERIISGPLCARIRHMQKETGTTLYMLLLAVYNVLLSRYYGSEDVIVGSPVAGRQYTDFDNLIGLFINTLTMRNYPAREKSFRDFLLEVRENTLAAYENQGYPFDTLLSKVSFHHQLSRNNLFDVELVVQNMAAPDAAAKDLEFGNYEIQREQTQTDLGLYVMETEEEIQLALNYATALFKKSTMEDFLQFFESILQTVTNEPTITLENIKIPLEPGVSEAAESIHQDDDDGFGF